LLLLVEVEAGVRCLEVTLQEAVVEAGAIELLH
jgi:hypothetical protein